MSVCSVEGCERSTHARGWCRTHYRRWKENVDLLTPIRSYPNEIVRGPMKRDDPRHGTINGYSNLECRCQECRRAWAQEKKRQRREYELAPNDPRHGTANGYNNYRCSCAKCRAAWAAKARQKASA